MNQKNILKKMLLILFIVTALIAAYINISNMIEGMRAFSSFSTSNMTGQPYSSPPPPPVTADLFPFSGVIFSLFNIGLFIFIIFFYRYKKINLLWILLPYLGSLIFGQMKLFEKEFFEDENEKTVTE